MKPASIAVHMIAFAGYAEAVRFLRETEDYISGELRQGRPEIAVVCSIVPTAAEAVKELCVPADLILVSAHGPCFIPGRPLDPRIGDGVSRNRLNLSDFGRGAPGKIGARAGIVWDVCHAGRPKFREELEPHLGHEVTHVGVIGKVFYRDSEDIVRAILRMLLKPEIPLITPETVAAAAAAAQAVTRRRLVHMRLGHEALRSGHGRGVELSRQQARAPIHELPCQIASEIPRHLVPKVTRVTSGLSEKMGHYPLITSAALLDGR